MSFTKQDIASEIYYLIDIGSYKLKALCAECKNKHILIHEYVEKRQDESHFVNNQCVDFWWLSENISTLISQFKKHPADGDYKLVVSYPFWDIFTKSKKINYKRDNPRNPINHNELEKIIESVEKLCIEWSKKDIYNEHFKTLSDMHIILSKIGNISIDNVVYPRVIGNSWQSLRVPVQNVFIPKASFDALWQLSSSIGKKVDTILPSEYCIAKILEQADVCLIHIWASSTWVTLKQGGEVVSMVKIPIGIGHLIEKIRKSTAYVKSQIIEHIDDPSLFLKEKAYFLEIWQESIVVSLSEILGSEICPHNFFVSWGGKHNSFIHDALKDINFSARGIKMAKKIHIIPEDMARILKELDHISLDHINKIPLSLFAMLIEIKNMKENENDILSVALENAVKKLWY